MKILKPSEKRQIEEKLFEQFGIEKLNYVLLKTTESENEAEKLRIYSGNFSIEEIEKLNEIIKIESIGSYFARNQGDGIRLTIDGAALFKNQINKNILEVDDKQAEKWLRGEDLDIKSDIGFKAIKNQDDFLGSGKSTGERIINTVPKERRMR
jgi:NOL1/NOP2/fmu family ribosome biogenesis protein